MQAPKRRPGQPTKYRADFHCDDFIRLSEQGKTFAQIAKEWKVDRDSVLEWSKTHKEFSGAVKRGRQIAEAWYMDLGQAAMIGQASMNGQKININVGMFCWMTKNMFRWTDRVETTPQIVEPKPENPCKQMTDDELDNA
jgi:hypothetical protein